MSAPSGPSSKYHPATIIFHLGQDAATSVGIEGIAVFAWLMGLYEKQCVTKYCLFHWNSINHLLYDWTT